MSHCTSLLHESHLPPSFWPKAVATVVHTHNRMPTSALHESTPFSALFNKKPDVSLLRVFGSLAYVHIQKDKRTGLSSHVEKAIFIGYPNQFKGWEFYNPITKKIILSDRADFDERTCPGLSGYMPDQNPLPLPDHPPHSDSPTQEYVVPDVPQQVGELPSQVGGVEPLRTTLPSSSSSSPSNASSDENHSIPQILPYPAPSTSQNLLPTLPSTQPPTPTPPAQPQPSQLRRSTRVRADPAVWRQNWFKATYKPSSAVHPQPTIQPSPDHAPDDSAQPHDYRNPSPLVEDSESDHESQHPPSISAVEADSLKDAEKLSSLLRG